MVSIPMVVFGHDVGRSGRNCYLKSQEWCSGTVQHRQDATVEVIRGVVPGKMFKRLTSNGPFPS
eukprot:6898262-Pyramimonas_sp.AAC.1